MIRCDFHTHTCFSDGANTPEEMVQEAIRRGMTAIGFSDHSYTSFDLEPCMPKESVKAYQAEIQRLKECYSGQIRILCGIEQDIFSDEPAVGFDYIIGSVHYVPIPGGYLAVDDTPEVLQAGVQQYFHGDYYAMTDAYWQTVAQVVSRTGADLIGHLDLVRKFNRGNVLFDENSPRYIDAAIAAVDELLKTGKPFEINTGAISRGYQEFPYPGKLLMDYILQRGGQFILSSDSHRKDTLCYGFEALENWQSFSL